MKTKRLFLLVIACVAANWMQARTYTPDSNNRIYVNQSVSNGTQDGSSWANAVPDLAIVLHDVSELRSEYPDELHIWVAEGEYESGFVPSGGEYSRDATFYIPQGVSLYGGFAGDESDIKDRDVVNNITVLNGLHGGGVYHVVLITQNDVTLDGFTITGGLANGTGKITTDGIDIYRYNGAGIYVAGTNETAIRNINLSNLIITRNTADYSTSSRGGGIYMEYSSQVTMSNMSVTGNTCLRSGGGIYIVKSSDVVIKDGSVISENQGTSGAGVYADLRGDFAMSDVLVSGNEAESGEGIGIYYSTSNGAEFTMNNVTVTGNHATGTGASNGAGIYLSGTSAFTVTMEEVDILENYAASGKGMGLYVGNNLTLEANNIEVSGNYTSVGSASSYGAGIYLYARSSSVFLSNASICNNTASSGSGGGIYVDGSSFSMNNTKVYGNSSATIAGLYLNGASDITFSILNSQIYSNANTASSTSSPGGVYCNTSLTLKNSMVCKNTGGNGFRDIYLNMDNDMPAATIKFTNSTVISEDGEPALRAKGKHELTLKNSVIATANANSLAVSTSDTKDRPTKCYLYNSYIQVPSGASNAPSIVSEVNGISGTADPTGFFVGTGDNPYQLANCSPLINAGNNEYVESGDKDAIGSARINNNDEIGIVDIGAFEYQGEFPPQFVRYNNSEDETGLLLNQNVKSGEAITDILFRYGGAATGVEVEGLPGGIEVETISASDGTFKLTGTPTGGYGIFNYTITTTAPDDACSAPATISGTIFFTPELNPDSNGVLYVKKGATGDGSSWEDALGELADALIEVGNNSDIKQIWVGTGTKGEPATFYPKYHIAELDVNGDNTTDADKTFLLLNGTKIYGGFDPEGGITDLTHERDSSLTVLNGQLSESVHVYHVVTALNSLAYNEADEVNHIVIDGFSITGGKAIGTTAIELSDYAIFQNRGAGIYSESGAGYITINGNFIHSNIASGKLYNYGIGAGILASGYQQITNNRISGNEALGLGARGGGVAILFKENIPNANRLPISAGLLRASTEDESYISNVYVAQNQIVENKATGPYTAGGGIVIYSDGSLNQQSSGWESADNLVQVLYNTIMNNTAGNESNSSIGGGISLGYVEYNIASRSGRGEIDRSLDAQIEGNVVIAYNMIAENEALGKGGGIYSGGTDYEAYFTSIVNNVIVENSATVDGGGGYLNYSGGACLNNTISANSAPNGVGGGLYVNYGSFRIWNSIITGNISEAAGEAEADLYFSGNENDEEGVFAYNLIGIYKDNGSVLYPPTDGDATGNIVGTGTGYDPGFVGSGTDKYNLASSDSPAVNKGFNNLWSFVVPVGNVDFIGNTRIFNKVIDMGAYEAEVCPESVVAGGTTITITPDSNGIIYVKDYSQSGAGSEPSGANGSSWEKAHPSLADALLYAYYYPDCLQEIWVAEGTYYPKYDPSGNPLPSNPRDKTFRMVDGVSVYGGFPANATTAKNNNKDNITHCNWNKWETIMSGDLGEKNDNVDNAYHVVISIQLSALTELNGLVITGGNANDDSYASVSIPTSTYPLSVYRRDGAGIHCSAEYGSTTSTLYVKNVIIRNNSAGFYGGGVFIYAGCNPAFVNTLIHSNSACNGGGVYMGSALRSAVSVSNPTFINVTIADNISTCGETHGGGMQIDGSVAHPYIYNTIIWGNSTNEISSGIVMRDDGDYTASNSIIQDVTGSNPLFVDAENSNYRLQPGSPGIDTGNNTYYHTIIGVEKAADYPADERDLGAIVRIQGAVIDMGAYEFSPCPPVVVWLGKTSDWHTPSNWSPAQVPQSCTDVYIPGKAVVEGQSTYVFPMLTSETVSGIANNTCDRIFFMPGAQLGRPDLLTYTEAHVEINYNGKSSLDEQAKMAYTALLAKVESSHTTGRDVPITSEDRVKFGASSSGVVLNRGRWNMLSAPLGEISTGDFAFGGFPFSYIQKYDANGETKSYIVGNWADFSDETNLIFQPGQGFGHYYYDYEENTPFGMDNSKNGSQWADAKNSGVLSSLNAPSNIRTGASGYGLAQSNSILHFPYFEDEYLSDARRIHEYAANADNEDDKTLPGVSTFNHVWQQLGSSFLQWGAGTQSVNRTTAAYRFILDNDWEDYEYVPNGTFTGGNIVLVGNPYMSALDFDAFYNANSDVIKKVYHIYQKTNTYVTYGTSGLIGDDLTINTTSDKYIAPMQSFLVEVAEGISEENISLLFDAETMAKTSTTTLLRSSQNAAADNCLTISASNAKGNSAVWLRQSETASDDFCNEDFSKIIDKVNANPVVYTLAATKNGASRALLLNSIQSNKTVVPIGIASTYSGEITLTVSGMDNYDADVFFVDAVSGISTEITGQTEFSYAFNYQPGTDSSLENRFSLRFSNSTTGMELIETRIVVYASGGDLVLLSNESDPILSVAVYDLQGRCILQKSLDGAASYRLENTLQTAGVYLVKVQTRQGVKDAKVIR